MADRRLTLGYRARIKPTDDPDRWKEYKGHEVLLTERSSSGGFAALVLKEGTNVPLTKGTGTVVNGVAWIDESELDFVDADLETNMDFIDWFQEHEDNFCPDCLHFCPDEDHDPEDGFSCPECMCQWG